MRKAIRKRQKGGHKTPPSLELELPTPADMTGKTCPVGEAVVHVKTQSSRERALVDSWRTVPSAVCDLLDREDHLD